MESFEGKIKFNKNKENLIYDFSFDILHKGKEDVYPPNTLNLSYYDKFYLFNQVLKNIIRRFFKFNKNRLWLLLYRFLLIFTMQFL